MENKIQFNAAIYPKVMSIIIGKPYNKNENDSDEMVLELVVDLPRSAYLIYLQKIFDEHVEPEIDLFKKYAYGVVLDDSDYMTLLSFIMTTTQRNWNKSINSGDLLAPFGLCMKVDDAGKRNLELLEETKDSIRVEAWEGIIIDLLSKSSMDIISCFDFDEHFERQAENSINDKLYISLGAWKYTPDTAEQNLSNALRAAFMFTLVGYYSGDRKNQYSSFVDYFEAEFYKRVSLVYGMWVSLEDKTKIKYLPLYDSFYNLTSSSKNELISVLKAVLDNDSIALDEKQTLKAQLIESAGQFHTNISSADVSLEQTLIKPVINLVLLKVDGAFTYVNGQYVTPFSFDASALTDNQSFTISSADLFKAYCLNKDFRKAIDTGKFVYVEGHVCLDDEKYIIHSEGRVKLTQYAFR